MFPAFQVIAYIQNEVKVTSVLSFCICPPEFRDVSVVQTY